MINSDKEKILLSICLPTYNQPQDFKRTLLSIVSQLNENSKKEVEILIGDNSTNNETQEIVKKEFNFPYIKYFNNGGNLGLDKNILNLIEKAQGEYIWIIGDDIIEKGSLNYILNIVSNHKNLIFIWINYKDINTDIPYMYFSNDMILTNGKELLKLLTVHGLLFISTYIFNKNYLNQISIQEKTKFLNSGINYFAILLSLFSKYQNHQIYLVNYPYIISSMTPLRWDMLQILGINYGDIIKFYKKSLKIDLILERKLLREAFENFIRVILVQSLKDKSIRKKIYKSLPSLIKRYWWYYRFWIILPFLILPNPLGYIGLLVYKKFLKKFFKNKKIFQPNFEIFKEAFKNYYEQKN